MDISLGYCLRNVTRTLFVVLVATTWTSRAGLSFSHASVHQRHGALWRHGAMFVLFRSFDGASARHGVDAPTRER